MALIAACERAGPKTCDHHGEHTPRARIADGFAAYQRQRAQRRTSQPRVRK